MLHQIKQQNYYLPLKPMRRDSNAFNFRKSINLREIDNEKKMKLW